MFIQSKLELSTQCIASTDKTYLYLWQKDVSQEGLYFNPFSAGTFFIRQNLASVDP